MNVLWPCVSIPVKLTEVHYFVGHGRGAVYGFIQSIFSSLSICTKTTKLSKSAVEFRSMRR